jgi:hypothetical protein
LHQTINRTLAASAWPKVIGPVSPPSRRDLAILGHP